MESRVGGHIPFTNRIIVSTRMWLNGLGIKKRTGWFSNSSVNRSVTLSGDWSNIARLLLRSSCLLLLFLLPLNSFAQAHLWKYRPFRATDTEHSGGDHICDLRRDDDEDGRPDRLGDCVSVSGTVIAEPSTFETGGWIFWIRDHECGVMVYGEQENLTIGDSIGVYGWLRLTNGNYFFPETGLATLGDVAIENGGITLGGTSDDHQPLMLTAREFCSDREEYGGNLVRVGDLVVTRSALCNNGDVFIYLHSASDSIIVYLDADTECSLDSGPGGCFTITGMVIRMKTPAGFAPSPSWCIAPRGTEDVDRRDCYSESTHPAWGKLKSDFFNQD